MYVTCIENFQKSSICTKMLHVKIFEWKIISKYNTCIHVCKLVHTSRHCKKNTHTLLMHLHCFYVCTSSGFFFQELGITVAYFVIFGGASPFYQIWLILAILFKFVVHTAGVIMAILIWKVKVTPLNDAKYLIATILTMCGILILQAVVLFLENEYITVFAIIAPITVLAIVGVFLGFTFIPKVTKLVNILIPFRLGRFTRFFYSYLQSTFMNS